MTRRNVSAQRNQSRRAAVGSFVGTTLEWYDFFIYSTAAALVFGEVFFPTQEGIVGTLSSFATFAVGFAARPIGSILFGHLGDRMGRRNILMITLITMGIATVLIGCLPSYATAGVWAPFLLVVLRIIQGIALGGEWGGAALMSVENAPEGKKGFFGSATQIGSPAGLLLASSVIAGSFAISGDDFHIWGWRIPFLLSVVVMIAGIFIRMGVEESKDYTEAKKKDEIVKAPVVEVLRNDWRSVLIGAGLGAANNAIYYMVATYTLAYAVNTLGVSEGETLNHITIVSVCYFVSIPIFGWLGDKIGLRLQVVIAAAVAALFIFPYFLLIDTANPWVILIAMAIGLAVIQSAAYAPQPAIYAELFPAKYRYTGASLAYALPTTVVGGTTPFIATWLYSITGSNSSVAIFVIALCVIAGSCAWLAHRRHARALEARVADASEMRVSENA
jgi:MHS family shikimate/dehydroshikimate transporter-like MFS transporter